jgi:hypothetical protein
MTRSGLISAVCLAVIAMPAVVWPKGTTTKIEIRGDGLRSTIEITDPEILDRFSIWNGPGVSTSSHGKPDPPAWADPTKVEGRFVDWPRGWATERPSGLQRVEVTFYIGDVAARDANAARYVFLYEIDSAGRHGYVYLPQWKNQVVVHFVEGNWLHAAQAWDETMIPIVVAGAAGRHGAPRQSEPGCAIGHGSIAADGTIELRMLDDRDVEVGNLWRFKPGDPDYATVKARMGDVEPGRETRVSCWPPRT